MRIIPGDLAVCLGLPNIERCCDGLTEVSRGHGGSAHWTEGPNLSFEARPFSDHLEQMSRRGT